MKASSGQGFFLISCIVLSAAQGGCVQVLSSQPLSTLGLHSTTSSSPWSTPTGVDLGSIDLAYADFPFPTQPNFPAGTTSTFGDFQMGAMPTFAALAASFSDGTNFRGYGRYYKPSGLGGSGWAPLGSKFMQVDSPQTSGADSSMTQVSCGFSSGGLLIGAYSDQSALITDTADFTTAAGWNHFANPSATSASPPVTVKGSNGTYGSSSGIGWDPRGHAYLAYVENATNLPKVARYTAFTGWDTAVTATLTGDADQIQALGDGLGVTFIYRDPTAGQIRAAWTLDSDWPTPAGTQLSTTGADPQGFWAAADGNGNVVVVFIQEVSPAPTCAITPITTTGCGYRVFASVRGATGVWTGPTEIDVNLTPRISTSVFDPTSFDGQSYFTPAVAYVGSGRFLTAFAMINNVTHVSGIYSLGYTVGSGFDNTADTVTLEEVTINSLDQFRVANDLRMAGDGQGHALLMANYRILNSLLVPNSFGYKAFEYGGGNATNNGWDVGYVLDTPTCSSTTSTYCGLMEPTGAVFSSGESVIVMPVPDPEGDGTQFRLYTAERPND